jgi:hypothetical protein
MNGLPPVSSNPAFRQKSTGRSIDTLTGVKLDSEEDLRKLTLQHAAARRSDQHRLVDAVVEMIAKLGLAAEKRKNSAEHKTLVEFARLVKRLVLEGTLQQQFFCKVAAKLGVKREQPLAKAVKKTVVPKMIDALVDVMRVGAETTRDSAIEGLGALLKVAEGRPEELLPEEPANPDRRGDRELNLRYATRLDRRRRAVLAIADSDWREALFNELQKAIEPIVANARAKGKIEDQAVRSGVEDVLYRRYDLLRALPAMVRQGDQDDGQRKDIVRMTALLRTAAQAPRPLLTDPDPLLIVYARYQESVFRTIDHFMRRAAAWKDFDDCVAAAVIAIPQTLTGAPKVCNARVRSTVAILRTAISLIHESKGDSKTKAAVLTIAEELSTPRAWLNVGIAEGCYRGIAVLLAHEAHNKLSTIILDSVFKELRHEGTSHDPAQAHRRLIAMSSFRRILIELADRSYERRRRTHENDSALERALTFLLADPSRENVFSVFQPQTPQPPRLTIQRRSNASVHLIAAIGFENELLRKETFRWHELPNEQKTLLTRILAAQLHAVSRDLPEMARDETLTRVFTEFAAVAMSPHHALGKVWDLLVSLPSEAAESADPDIQRFVEYRGKRRRGEGNVDEMHDDLPGHVLAMISREASDRIAGAIAREIDLNLRHDRELNDKADFAEPLYQVMVRGPHESIFDHLMPRVTRPLDRLMVELFREHVAVVLKGIDLPPAQLVIYLRRHVTSLMNPLVSLDSPMLHELATALDIFDTLVSEAPNMIWKTITHHGVADFFQQLDLLEALAAEDKSMVAFLNERHEKCFERLDTIAADPVQCNLPKWQKLLSYRFARRLLDLQTDVKHYVELPVGNFAARSAALEKAAQATQAIERDLKELPGLQPPRRVLLTALMSHLHDVFTRTNRWYCVEAQRHMDEKDKDGFWIVFAIDMDRNAELETRLKYYLTNAKATQRVIIKQHETQERIAKLEKSSGAEPPRFEGQTQQFEELAIDWMASDLDLEALGNAVRDRWSSTLFRWSFDVVTRPWLMLLAILALFAFTAVAHKTGLHAMEGLGFWYIGATIVGGALIALVSVFTTISRPHPAGTVRKKNGYRFRSLMPPIAGLIAASMTLVVKFEHSYEFPLHASPFAIALLLLLAFVGTRLFVESQVVQRSTEEEQMSARDRQKVAKIVGVALAHAFAIAVLFSLIFADSHYRTAHKADANARLHHSDEEHDFLGLLPHQAFVDWSTAAMPPIHGLREWVRENGFITFYPTIILSWTAIGLFFGLVLEGIDKGDHLRRRRIPRSGHR